MAGRCQEDTRQKGANARTDSALEDRYLIEIVWPFGPELGVETMWNSRLIPREAGSSQTSAPEREPAFLFFRGSTTFSSGIDVGDACR